MPDAMVGKLVVVVSSATCCCSLKRVAEHIVTAGLDSTK